jgi:hypothetical protein
MSRRTGRSATATANYTFRAADPVPMDLDGIDRARQQAILSRFLLLLVSVHEKPGQSKAGLQFTLAHSFQ